MIKEGAREVRSDFHYRFLARTFPMLGRFTRIGEIVGVPTPTLDV